ncbi:MAG: YicC family protein [Chromatiales bacterium]|nr:YicC family protein [Chromatiales bacterium]
MIKSMTAFARCSLNEPWGSLSWELRTVNHRYLEIFCRLPEELRSLETAVREAAARSLKRGKLDVTLRYQPNGQTQGEFSVNHDTVRALVAAVREIETHMDSPTQLPVAEVLRWPGVLALPEVDMEMVGTRTMALLEEALAELVETREREGGNLRNLLLERCDAMAEQIALAKQRLPQVRQNIRQRLLDRLGELQQELDPNRLEQELLLLTQKLDVDEEMDRLESHVAEVRRVLNQNQPVGRRLDFLMQELNREANTLGSKSADVETTRVSVEMKVLIEQMREQIQNIE